MKSAVYCFFLMALAVRVEAAVGNLTSLDLAPCADLYSEAFKIEPYVKVAATLQKMPRTEALAQLQLWADSGQYPHQTMILCRLLFDGQPGQTLGAPSIAETQFSDMGGSNSRVWPMPDWPFVFVNDVPFLAEPAIPGHGGTGPAPRNKLGQLGMDNPSEYLQYCLAQGQWSTRNYGAVDAAAIQRALLALLQHPRWDRPLPPTESAFLAAQTLPGGGHDPIKPAGTIVSITPQDVLRHDPWFLTSTCAQLAEAANHLLAVGQTQAVAQLQILGQPDPAGWNNQEKHKSIIYLCRILFQTTAGGPLPWPAEYRNAKLDASLFAPKSWPDFPLARVNNIFFAVDPGVVDNVDALAYLKICQRDGVFRTQPLPVPTRREALAAEQALETSPAWTQIPWPATGLLRPEIENLAVRAQASYIPDTPTSAAATAERLKQITGMDIVMTNDYPDVAAYALTSLSRYYHDGRGIQFSCTIPRGGPLVKLNVKNISLPDALDQICRQLGCAYTIEQNGIVTLRPTPSNPPKKNDISRVSGPDSQVADLNAPFPPLYQDVVESELAQSIPGGGKMSFKGRDAAKVAEELTRLSVALSSPYKNGHGIQFVSGTNANPAAPNLEVIYDSLGNLLGQVCQQLNCTFTIEQNGVVMLRPNPAPTPRPSPK